MPLSHALKDLPSSYTEAVEALLEQIRSLAKQAQRCEDFQGIEEKLHHGFMEAECAVIGELLSHYDVDLPVLEGKATTYRRTLRCEQTYFSAAGPVRVTRSLYRTRRNGPTCCPLDWRAGIVEGRWTPRAAKVATEMVANMTPGEAERLLDSLGGMRPSKSTLDRLPKQLSARWEAHRKDFEGALRDAEAVPEEAVAMAVSLDGVLVPTRYAVVLPTDSRWAEASCGSVSFYDGDGELLTTRYYGRMPERYKRTLKSQLVEEVNQALAQRPDLQLVKVADGAPDNWSFFGKELPPGIAVLDFYHAAEHLKRAMDVIHGERSRESLAAYRKYRDILLNDPEGVTRLIRHLRYQLRKQPKRKALRTELVYFTRHQAHCGYAAVKADSLPIGSGVIEAACKTLVQQRLKRSVMRWDDDGGQAMLNFRALLKSGRFDTGWKLLADTYRQEVKLPKNLLPFKRK